MGIERGLWRVKDEDKFACKHISIAEYLFTAE